MEKFKYTAKDERGNTVKGELSAENKTGALSVLREKGFLVLKLDQVNKKSSLFSSSSLGSFGKKKVPLEEVVVFTRQLATLTAAGIPVMNALGILAEQTQNPTFKASLTDARDKVNTGSSLSEAFEKHRHIFSEFFVNMVKAGESSGMLDDVLERVASYLEKTSALRKKIKSAMIYPLVVSIMAVAISLVMIFYVIPVFEDIFSGFGAELPGPTQFLIDLSHNVRDNSLIFFVVSAAVIVAIKLYASSSVGRKTLDKIKLRLPVFGELTTKASISRFSRTLSTLIKSGVSILNALEIVAKTSENVVLEENINRVRQSVKEGDSIAGPMEKGGIFPPLVTRMIAVGEKTGEMEQMLVKIADFYDEQVNTMVEGLTSLLEPLIIAFLGIVIGGIVICMFMPIFQLSSLVNF